MKKLFYIILLLSTLPVSAQDFESDMLKVSENFKSDSYIIEIDAYYYAGHESMSPVIQDVILMKKQGDNSYTKRAGTEMIVNNPYFLIVDHNNKIMAIDKKFKTPTKKEKEQGQAEGKKMYNELYTTLGIDIDSTKTAKDVITINQKNNAQGSSSKKYEALYEYGDYERVIFTINQHTFLLEEIVFYSRTKQALEAGVYKKPKIKFVYTRQDLDPVFNKNEFNINRFLRKMPQGEFEISSNKYKSYTLMNNLDESNL